MCSSDVSLGGEIVAGNTTGNRCEASDYGGCPLFGGFSVSLVAAFHEWSAFPALGRAFRCRWILAHSAAGIRVAISRIHW